MTAIAKDAEGIVDNRIKELITQVDGLLRALDEETQRYSEQIDAAAPTHRAGAENLVHYANLRTRDVRPLQAGLTEVGATRLTTTEPSVKPRLQAARNVLGAFAGEDIVPGKGTEDAFARADDVLEDHAATLLGPTEENTHSRIMVTLPTAAAEEPDLVRGYVDAGMDLARINCAHDDEDAWQAMIENIHAAADEVGREVRIAMDLAGPKVRTGAIADGPEIGRARVSRTVTGETTSHAKLWISPDDREMPPLPDVSGRDALGVQVDPEWYGKLAEGSEISLIDVRDSRRKFTVVRVEDGAVLAEGEKNAYLTNGSLLEHDYEKTRVSGIPPIKQKLRLHIGDRLVLTTDQVTCDPNATEPKISCTVAEAVEAIGVDEDVLFDDGAIAARAVDKRIDDHGYREVELEVTRASPGGTNLKAFKGINLPQSDLPLPSLTSEDVTNLRFVARYADIANVSFIRNPDDVITLLDTLEEIATESEDPERVRNLGLVLKIETIPAYENLPDVLLAGMRHANLGVMIARGDLAVELGFERLAEVPRLIASMAEAAHVPTIMATQVLENLAKAGLPSRAEITDAAYALRAEAVMLNKGPHITDAIRILNSMSEKLGASQRKNRMLLRKIKSWDPQR